MAQSSAKRMRSWQGPALFSFGFRPFFFFGAIWAGLAMCLWLAMLAGVVDFPTRFDRISWHAHEFLFGYLGAVIAGFLLTAVPNWSGRLPIVGWWLVGLFALWCAGRIAILYSQWLPLLVAPSLDLAFPVLLGLLILREIIAGKNWSSLIVVALLLAFTFANALFHYNAVSGDYAAYEVGLRFGLATAVMMIVVIGGRIVPSFTRNWLAQQESSAHPAAPMLWFDKIVLLASLPILALWTIRPNEITTGVCLLVFGGLHLLRLARWQGHHTLAEPLVFVLHASYAFVPLGAIALGLEQVLVNHAAAEALHLWMVGAIGTTTLAVMTRATLGHTGQKLSAGRATVAIYLFIFGAAFTRFLASAYPELSYVSGTFWLLAFSGFAFVYGPFLVNPKPNHA